MNRFYKLFVVILVITMALLVLTSCINNNENIEISAEEQLDILLNNLKNNTQKVTGSLHYNDKQQQTYTGFINKPQLKLSLKANDIDYFYSSRTLLKNANDKFIVENPSTTLSEQKNLIPFNLLYFNYSDGNSDNIFMTQNTINISFINRGAILSFQSRTLVLNGLLSITFHEDNITSSVFTAFEGKTKVTAYYQYSPVEHNFVQPIVAPTDTLIYAVFALSIFTSNYAEHTIHTKDEFDTEARLTDISLDSEKVKSVTCVDITDKNIFYTLTINYNNKEMIIGIGSAITSITFAFDNNYKISYLRINATDYILK